MREENQKIIQKLIKGNRNEKPYIKYFNIFDNCYINSNWDAEPMFQSEHWGDARLEKNAETKNFWLNEINQDRYLKASPDLFRLLGWIKEKP